MATEYQEIELSENKKQAQKERNINHWLFGGAFGISLIIIGIAARFFSNNNCYGGDGEWVIKHDVVGSYGDFVGGVLGTLVALYCKYSVNRVVNHC